MEQPMRLCLKVRHYEVDEYGHVNHANYVHYLETARIEALNAVGLSIKEMRRQGILAVAADLSVKYHSPASPGETLEIVTHVREIRGARSLWVQEIREASSQRVVATAEVTGAFMTEGGRPVRAPQAFRERLATLFMPGGDAAVDALAPALPPGRTVTARSACVCLAGGLRETLRGILGGAR